MSKKFSEFRKEIDEAALIPQTVKDAGKKVLDAGKYVGGGILKGVGGTLKGLGKIYNTVPSDKNKIMNMFKKQMTNREFEITFTKKNGEDRKIKCTVDPNYCEHISGKDEYVVVFDTEEQDYRTVNTSTIKEFKLVF